MVYSIIRVNCRDGAGQCDEEIPYGLAVTLEVAEGLLLPLYAEIAERIRPRVTIEVEPP